MRSVAPDYWEGAPGLTVTIRCMNLQCKKKIPLLGYKIDATGGVTPAPVRCTHCGESNGEIRLVGWPPVIDWR